MGKIILSQATKAILDAMVVQINNSAATFKPFAVNLTEKEKEGGRSMAEADDTATIGATGSIEKAQMSIGADYNFTSKTRAFAWYTTKEDTKKAAVNNIEETILALGVEHKF